MPCTWHNLIDLCSTSSDPAGAFSGWPVSVHYNRIDVLWLLRWRCAVIRHETPHRDCSRHGCM